MGRERVRLPTDADLALSSVQWAMDMLEEEPIRLRVSCEEDNAGWWRGACPVEVDPALTPFSWVLEGDTREVYSDGA